MRPYRSSRRRDLSICAAVFGSAFLYCLYGAVRSHLVIPGRYKPGSAIFAGPAAWTLVLGVVCIWLGVSIRIGLFSIHDRRVRLSFELTFLLLGVAGLYGAGFLPTITHVP